MVDLYFLLGEEVSGSPSPAMMNAAFRATGLSASYKALSVGKEEFRARFLELRKKATGLNLTIPFKSEVLPLLDRLDEVSSRIRAANVVKVTAEGCWGYNTDVDGITAPLIEHGKTHIEHALLVGAGGAARSFCEAMSQMRCPKVTISVRDKAKGVRFSSEMSETFPEMKFDTVSLGEMGPIEYDLIFNATPLGTMGAAVPDSLKRVIYGFATVFDAVYRPTRTELLAAAEERGASIILGHEMLLNQGTKAFEIWTGRRAPKEEMREALLDAVGRGT